MKKNINNNNNNNKYCNNCGKIGHTQHECVLPIISIGVILFRIKNNIVEYLLIRRKESFGFCDFIKNKSKNYNKAFLSNVVDEMTLHEKEIIKRRCSDDLTNEIINNSKTMWTEPEWGFPKGRRNNGEKDLDCGLREFHEETGYELSDIELIENINPYEEIFIGSNLKSYKQKYYLAYTTNNTDILDKYQQSEVSKIGWFNINDCRKIIRSYNSEKINLINNIHKTITNYQLIKI
jgi:ADP-ribose pyrophosphatase YjhB (NUDIX family)